MLFSYLQYTLWYWFCQTLALFFNIYYYLSMSFNRKTSKGSSLDLYKQDKGKAIQVSSGQSPVNDDGSTYDNSIQLNWPYQQFTTDNQGNPISNDGKPKRLSQTIPATTDFRKGK